MPNDFTAYAARLREFIRCYAPEHRSSNPADGAEMERQFSGLARELFRLQFHANVPFRALCQARRVSPENLADWRDIPAVPTAAFKESDLTCLAPEERTAVFHSSGTTEQRPSRHFHSPESLALYQASLKPWFARHLLDHPEGIDRDPRTPSTRPAFLALTPPPEAAPRSSLVHMLDVVGREFGAQRPVFVGTVAVDGTWSVDVDRVMSEIEKGVAAKRPLVLSGTAFNFVHLLDHLAVRGIRWYRLPHGSRVMETGGYKGRSRELPKAELHRMLTERLGVVADHIVTEYGMSELSSQAYEPRTSDPEPRTFLFPPWARATVVSPETGREVADGVTGLLRIVDLANAWSVMAVQTGDLAIRRGARFELLGRAATVEPRGCSLMTA